MIGVKRQDHATVINALANQVGVMKTSPNGLKLIEQREGIRLGAYRDSRGLFTIGVGHLSNSYFPVHAGQIISEAKALDLLARDLGEVEHVINTVVKAPLTQNQFDAMASLGFNIGCGGLAHSTVVHFVNLRDYVRAADAFLNWAHPAVLHWRREAERHQFIGA